MVLKKDKWWNDLAMPNNQDDWAPENNHLSILTTILMDVLQYHTKNQNKKSNPKTAHDTGDVIGL